MKPTVEKIITMERAYRSHWGALHDKQALWQKYYQLENEVKLPEGIEAQIVRGRTAYELVQVGVNNHLLDNPRVEITPKNEKHDVSTLEAFGNALLERAIPKIRANATLQIGLGAAAYKVGVDDTHVGWDWTSVKNKTEVSDLALTKYPITISTPHFFNVFPSPYFTSDYIPSNCLESYNMNVANALAMCESNGWSTSWFHDQDMDSTVAFIDWASDEWRCVLIEKEPVLPGGVAPNPLGFCPYIIFPAGMGMPRADCDPVGDYQSILGSHTSSIDFENQLMVHLLSMTQGSAWPQLVFEPDANSGVSAQEVRKAVGEELEVKPGWAIVTPEGTKLKYLEVNGTSMSMVLQALGMIQGQQNSPVGMSGGQMRGVYSGTYANTRIGYEKTWYKNAFKIHEDALALVVGRAYQIIKEVIGHPITVKAMPLRQGEPSGITRIGPKDIPDYNCRVELLADSPEAADVKKHIGLLAKQAGVVDTETALVEYFDKTKKEASRIYDAMMTEKVENLPVPLQALSIKIYEAKGEDDMAAFIRNMMWEQARGGARTHPGAQSEPATKSVPQRNRPEGETVNPNATGSLP